ncbi:hypothetical protein HMPREF0185_03174 [Brevundimonas diminuta 470-4]|nr:hypothetical protein HMPREF0185_03174 [Brevundimonas diminuta 470-4]
MRGAFPSRPACVAPSVGRESDSRKRRLRRATLVEWEDLGTLSRRERA